MRLAAGSRMGAYEVGVVLSAGGMGEVYRARDTRLNRDVALKVLGDRRDLRAVVSLQERQVAGVEWRRRQPALASRRT
jgi:hypothetical protein